MVEKGGFDFMQRSSLPLGVSTLKKWYFEKGGLRGDLPFQRHSGMWNNITQSNLVWGLLAYSYIPPIVLLKDKAGKDEKGKEAYSYQILDGLQRLTTLFKFIDNEYALHSATPEVEIDGTIYDLAGLKFEDMSEECKNTILNYRFSVQCLENYTYEEAEKLFFNINSGVALSTIQKSKAKMGTELISFLNELLAMNFFTQGINITEKQAKSEDDLCLLLQAMLLLDNMYEDREYKNISTGTCLSYAESVRGKYSEAKRDRLIEIVNYLSDAFPVKNKFLRKNNVPIVMVVGWIALQNNVSATDFRKFINDFASSVNVVYDEAGGSGNIRAAKVQMRLRVLFLEMCKFFDINPEETLKPFSDEISLFLEEDSSEDKKITNEEWEEVLNRMIPPKEDVETDLEEAVEVVQDYTLFEVSVEEPAEEEVSEEDDEYSVEDEVVGVEAEADPEAEDSAEETEPIEEEVSEEDAGEDFMNLPEDNEIPA